MNTQLFQISTSIIIVIATMVIALLVNRLFKALIQRSTTEMKNDPTNYIFLRHALTALIYIIGFSVAIYVCLLYTSPSPRDS